MTTEASWVDSMPAVYDRCLGPAIFSPWAALVAEAVAARRPRRVLELAAGTGILTRALVDALGDGEVAATDLNPAMVAWGESHVPGASWRVADAQALDFADGSCDAVVCQFGVMFFPDRPTAYAEVRRVLAPEGMFVFAVWDELEGSTLAASLVAGLNTVFPDDPPTFLARVPHGYHDVAEIEADLSAGGLTPVSLDHLVPVGTAASAADIANGFCYGTPLRFELERRGALDDVAAAIAAQMTTRLGTGPVAGELAGFLVTARPAAGS